MSALLTAAIMKGPAVVRLTPNLAVLLLALPALAQSNSGELRLKVRDPHGAGVRTVVELVCEANDFHDNLETDDSGRLVAKRLRFGVYRARIQEAGFAPATVEIEVRSAIPVQYSIVLTLPSVSETVTVEASPTLLDPHQANSANQISSATIETRTTSLPGRSLQDLVNSQPGWLYEGNAVLHPRGAVHPGDPDHQRRAGRRVRLGIDEEHGPGRHGGRCIRPAEFRQEHHGSRRSAE